VNESEIVETIPSLVKISRRIVGNIDDAEEVVQGALLEIVQQRDRWDRIASWQGFLRHLVTKRSLDRLRKRPFPNPLSSEPNDPSQLEPYEQSMQQELMEQFRTALSRLSDREAEIFSMRYLADQTNIEISQVLNLTQNSVAVLLKRARKKLQQLMEVETFYDR
jgi:RNA polymerase sigma-70 factor (ECF subfamily)